MSDKGMLNEATLFHVNGRNLMYAVDIDTGGTMTDCLVTGQNTQLSLKVDTTPHDFTVSFNNCLTRASAELGFDNEFSFLREVSIIRWSSTITTNVLAERRGAKVGLIVSPGAEENLYGSSRSPVVDQLVASEHIIGLAESAGAEVILAAVKGLLENGARRICISLKDSFPDNTCELNLKQVIEDQYPDHIIGSVPVLLGSEMAQIAHDQTRTHYSLMNAYTHTHLANSLFKIEDMLRDDHGWSGALLVGHTSGGVARIGKTKAVDTIESGPVFGTFGAAYMARQYGLKDLLCLDVGGTTTKTSVVKDSAPVFKRGGELMGIPVETSFALLRSAALGGGSVARVKDGMVALGPDSMGAAPGPACYGLGGSQATLTDALLVLGYLDSKNFLGGRRELDIEKARAAIENNVARHLSMTVDQTALAIRDEAVRQMAGLLGETLAETKVSLHGCTLFAYGGNGPMFGAFVAKKLGIRSVLCFDLGPVFSAFGSAISDVVHVYERGIGKTWVQSQGDVLIETAETVYRQAVRDLDGEGFDPGKAIYRYSLDIVCADGEQRTLSFESSGIPGAEWMKQVLDAASTAGISNDDIVLIVTLRTEYGVDSHELVTSDRVGGKLQTTKRSMHFSEEFHGSIMAAQWDAMGVGDHINGPAMINGQTLTCAVPPGWSSVVDEYGNIQLKQNQGKGGQ